MRVSAPREAHTLCSIERSQQRSPGFSMVGWLVLHKTCLNQGLYPECVHKGCVASRHAHEGHVPQVACRTTGSLFHVLQGRREHEPDAPTTLLGEPEAKADRERNTWSFPTTHLVKQCPFIATMASPPRVQNGRPNAGDVKQTDHKLTEPSPRLECPLALRTIASIRCNCARRGKHTSDFKVISRHF